MPEELVHLTLERGPLLEILSVLLKQSPDLARAMVKGLPDFNTGTIEFREGVTIQSRIYNQVIDCPILGMSEPFNPAEFEVKVEGGVESEKSIEAELVQGELIIRKMVEFGLYTVMVTHKETGISQVFEITKLFPELDLSFDGSLRRGEVNRVRIYLGNKNPEHNLDFIKVTNNSKAMIGDIEAKQDVGSWGVLNPEVKEENGEYFIEFFVDIPSDSEYESLRFFVTAAGTDKDKLVIDLYLEEDDQE